MSRPKLLDAFCGAGGCSMGYYRAGFEVVGVDIEPQPRYPFEFHQADALEFIAEYGAEFDVIHASPPCQYDSITARLPNVDRDSKPQLIEPTRTLLQATGKPYVIENVPGAPLINPLMLCGTMFGLRVIRHRLFETHPVIWWSPHPCNHNGKAAPVFGSELKRQGYLNGETTRLDSFEFITVVGRGFLKGDAQIAMNIDWMTSGELAQAIPPAYTEWIGRRLLEALDYSYSDMVSFNVTRNRFTPDG